jgi:hypothetical protein
MRPRNPDEKGKPSAWPRPQRDGGARNRPSKRSSSRRDDPVASRRFDRSSTGCPCPRSPQPLRGTGHGIRVLVDGTDPCRHSGASPSRPKGAGTDIRVTVPEGTSRSLIAENGTPRASLPRSASLAGQRGIRRKAEAVRHRHRGDDYEDPALALGFAAMEPGTSPAPWKDQKGDYTATCGRVLTDRMDTKDDIRTGSTGSSGRPRARTLPWSFWPDTA